MGKVIEIKANTLSSCYLRVIGLIGKKKITPVFFKTRLGIHTFGVKEPIDVVILDKKYKVRKIKKELFPNRIFLWNFQFDGVLELPRRYIKNKQIETGDTIFVSNGKELE